MLLDFLFGWIAGLAEKFSRKLAGAVPDPPAWAHQGAVSIAEIVQKAGQLDAWVPISEAAPVLAFIPVAIAAGIAIKLLRVFLSLATLGGGSAG